MGRGVCVDARMFETLVLGREGGRGREQMGRGGGGGGVDARMFETLVFLSVAGFCAGGRDSAIRTASAEQQHP